MNKFYIMFKKDKMEHPSGHILPGHHALNPDTLLHNPQDNTYRIPTHVKSPPAMINKPHSK